MAYRRIEQDPAPEEIEDDLASRTLAIRILVLLAVAVIVGLAFGFAVEWTLG